MLKRALLTLIISFLAVFQTGCDALENLIPKGCNIEGYPNYNSANILPCDDENGDGNLNDCCGEFSEGCTDATADNYVGDATVASTSSCEDCCIAKVGGCTDCGANNYDATATDDDGSCSYDTAGCIDPSACCNIADHASNDCSNVAGGDDASCCSSTSYTTCYLDLNNNQIWEEMDNTGISTCDCGDLGTGWVSEEFVSGGPEVVGCTNSVLSGADIGNPDLDPDENYVCSEYGQSGEQGNEYANVDDGSCCINDPQPMSGFEEGSAELMLGTYNVIIQLGNADDSEGCIVDPELTEEEFGYDGPETRVQIMTLGLNGTFQHYEAKIDNISMRPEDEYDPTQNDSFISVEECENKASDADYWYCDNWGDDYQNCEDFTYYEDCPGYCRWETNFCHPEFQGQPCHAIKVVDGNWENAQQRCWDNDCEWDEDNYNCFQPSHIPGSQCWGMGGDDCADDGDCIMAADFVDCSMCDCDGVDGCVNDCCGHDGEQGAPDCILDCEFPADGLNTESGYELCGWITTTLIIDGVSQDCMDGCDEEYIYDDEGNYEGNMTGQVEELAGQCELCLDAGDNAEQVCNYMWDEDEGDDGPPGPGPGGPDCSEWQDGTACTDVISKDACFCDANCMWQGDENGNCIDDMCAEYAGDNDTCLSTDECDLVYPGNLQFNCTDNNGCCVTMHDDGAAPCLVKNMETGEQDYCPGITDINSNSTGTEVCEFFVGLVVDGVGNNCIQDCAQETYMGISWNAWQCEACLAAGNCDDIGLGDRFAFDPEVSLPGELALQLSRMQAMSQLNNSLSRSDDCSFDDGYLDDCSADGDCCPTEWVGDGFCDGLDQEYGCDLTCYQDVGGSASSPENDNLDGGDCGVGFSDLECVPKDDCWYNINEVDCAFSGCIWEFTGNPDTEHCHPRPDDMGSGDNCGEITNQDWCEDNVLCQWKIPPADAQIQNPHCVAIPPNTEACFNASGQDECSSTEGCKWNAPDWMQSWQDGACFNFNICAPYNSPDICTPVEGCDWDWEDNQCVELSSGDDGCRCRIAHTERTCNEGATVTNPQAWETAPWCNGDDSDCDEMHCMVPMEPQDCTYEHFEFDDPCAVSDENMHLNIEWVDQACVVIKSKDDGGLWEVTGGDDGEFCIAFPYEPDPDCEDIYSPDECHCYNCQWSWNDDGEGGECQDRTGQGREKRLEQKRNYQNIIYSLSNSCSQLGADEGDYDKRTFFYSFPYTHNLLGGTIENGIYLWSEDGDGGCTEVLLVPVTGNDF